MTAGITAYQLNEHYFRDSIAIILDGVFSMSSHEKERSEAGLDLDDAQIISTILGGDSNAFEHLIEKYQTTIASQMFRFSRHRDVVEELTHDVFVQAYHSLKSYRSKAPLIHWLRKIAVRVGYRFWKDQKRQRNIFVPFTEIEGGLESLTANSITDASEAREALNGLLELLRPRDRLILTLLYWDGYSVAEAAKLAGWSQTMVKVQSHRARKKLRKLLEDETIK